MVPDWCPRRMFEEKNSVVFRGNGMEISRAAESLNDKISQYKTEWRLHVERMDSTRLPIRALDYRSRAKRMVG